VDQDVYLFSLLASGLAYCRVAVVDNAGLMASLAFAGLVGGVSHCAGMCGPFVLAQCVARLEARPAAGMGEIHRLGGAALATYHLGRMTTYVGLGVAAAAIAEGLTQVTGFKWGAAALLGLAALFFLGYAVRRLGVLLPWLGRGGESWWSRHIGRIARPLFARPVGWRGYVLGFALGFLPCGLLYGAVAAAASGGVLAAGLAMVAFALGTVPALVAVGLAGHVAGLRWQGLTARLAPGLLMINAVALTYMAWRLVA
jgi:sulfite exporter TauE/SafE